MGWFGVSGSASRARSVVFSLIGLAATVAVGVVASAVPAEAARKKKRAPGYSPPYAAMVVDVKSGRTLHAVNEDALRHPASITKVMTLYMLFEQMERGRFRMDTPLRVSAYAAARPPSKIGVVAGETIDVEDAIRALITKSANDVAVVVAENLAGDEDTFAEQMTRRARTMGMTRTVFRNASGLPDPQQVTTARDLTILARAIQERFPRYFHLFQTRHFEWAGRNHRNHNKLLGRVEGVDGIKTGYTRASGFNLMTSARADGRQIVSIVLGGRSGAHRDGIMRNLVVAHLPRASTGPQRVMVAQAQDNDRPERAERQETRAEARPEPRQPQRPEAQEARQPVRQPAPAAAQVAVQSEPPARPVARPVDLSQARPVTASAAATAFAAPTATSTSQQAMRWAVGATPAGGREIRPPANVGAARVSEPVRAQPAHAVVAPPPAVAQPAPRPASQPGVLPSRADAPRPPANVQFTSSIAKAPEPAAERVTDAVRAQAAQAARTGWIIQIGATDDEAKARGLLDNARRQSRALAEAQPFTEPVERGGATLFRARFGGFEDQAEANNACRDLKRSGVSCFAARI
jgi:D-alanyl-D-alanine carboxypeptidase